MPESVTDRCTKSHEYIFLLSKSAKYYYDAEAIKEPVAVSTKQRMSQDIDKQRGSDRVPGKTNGPMKAVLPRYGGKKYTENPEVFSRTKSGNAYDYRDKRNKRDVWSVSTKPYKGAHFATFPPELIIPCILAGCIVNGVVLDPFMGSGTTGAVAKKLGRNYIGFDLNGKYVELANDRIGYQQNIAMC
jgi:DNA modification methylase